MAAMQWVGLPPLAAAVSRSGGLGNITALSQPNPSALRIAIQHLRQDARGNPFCVNITTLPAIKPPDYLGYAKAAVEEGVKVVELAGIICEWAFFFLEARGCLLIGYFIFLVAIATPLIKYFKEQGCTVIYKGFNIQDSKVRNIAVCVHLRQVDLRIR